MGANPLSRGVNVFISYSRRDIDFAQKIFSALEARGLSCKIDTRDLPSLEEWRRELLGVIGAADAVVFIVSRNSVTSPVCTWEIEQVARLGKRLAPIVIERVEHDRIPAEIAKINYLFFDRDDAFERQADTLADALQTDLSWVKEHTRLGQLAERWVARNRPPAMLLRGQELEDAERWIGLQPRNAPQPTDAHRLLITQSRRASTRRRNLLTGTLAVGLLIAVGLAGFAYFQRQEAIANSGEAKIELSRALMAAGNPPAALSAAIDGTRTIAQTGGSTTRAEAALYELFWSKPLPVATVILNQVSTGMPKIALGSLSAKSRRDAEGKNVDVFCVQALRRRDEPAVGPDEYCLEFASRGLVSVPPSGNNTDAEFFFTARSVDEKDYERKENTISVNLKGKTYELAIDVAKSRENYLRVTTCNDRWIIAQSRQEEAGKPDFVTTILLDTTNNAQKTLTDAPFATNGQDPHCHSHSPYITLIGRGGPIVLVDGASGSSKVPELRKFSTFRHGFEDPDTILSLSVAKDIVLFSGADVAKAAGEQRIVTQPVIYQLSSGQPLATLEGHEQLISSAVLAKSGKWAATITQAGELRIWDVERALRIGRGRNSRVDTCKYDAEHALRDFDADDSVDIDFDGCNIRGKDYARVLALRHDEREAIVALKAPGGSKLLAIDGSGNVLREATVDVDLSDSDTAHWPLSAGALLAVLDKAGNVKLVSLAALGEVLATHGPKIRSASRVPDRDGGDALLIVDEQGGVGELAIDRSGARPSWSYRERKALLHTNKLAAVARFAGRANGADYDIWLEKPGRLFVRHGTYVYCAPPSYDWAYRPICTIMDSATGDPIGEHLCLAGRLTDDHLFCLAQDRRSIEAYSFARQRWITVASGAYVSPLEKRGGKILLHVGRFADCPNRIVLSYREFFNGGGGVRSPTQLLFDLDAQQQLMQLAPDISVGAPGFCNADALMNYAQRSEVGVKPGIGADSPPSQESGADAEAQGNGTKKGTAQAPTATLWADAYIEVGQKLIEAGNEPEAEEMFASALQHDPAATGRINDARTKARSRLWWSIVDRGANLQNSGKPEGVLIVGEALLDLTAEARNAIGIERLKASQAWWTGIGRLYPGAGRPGADRSRECDQLASYPFDPFRLASGVAMDSIKVEVALPACEDAVARYGSEARYLFQRGRVNDRAARIAKTGKDEATAKTRAAMAIADYEAAAAMGYPMAFNALAVTHGDGFKMEKNPNKEADYQLQTFNRVMQCCWAPVARTLLAAARPDPDKLARARRLVREFTRWSAALGSAQSRDLLSELVADGTLDPESPPPEATVSDLPPWLKSE